MERVIMHIDVNSAFLSWTAVDLLNKGGKYDIRNSYAVIGGDESKRHGIVLAKSNPAKKVGIITGEPLFSARKKCPSLNIYPPNHELYNDMSNKMFKLLSKYSPDIEVYSIDECFIDYTKVKKLYGNEISFAHKIKDEIKNTLGFTVNVGIGNNKLCAKVATDFSKPDKVHTLYNHEIKEKMHPLPINHLIGIGRKSSEKLIKLGINTIGDLSNCNPNQLSKYFKNQAIKIIELAKGIDNSEVISDSGLSKGISNSTTIAYNLTSKKEVYHVIESLVDNLATSLRKQKRYAYVIAIILKDKHFHSYSHQTKLINATNNTKEIYETAKKLFDETWDNEPIRLVGVRLDNLVNEVNHQISLFESVEHKELESGLESVVDELNFKYGSSVIKKASLHSSKREQK
ncbi:MAG: DNA polymerase IV [Bacilli bacterium]|nr:DNA polymerase IV [Bacilli bacterium]MDD4809329.1 DNA polymerase IV [Bacilli bacterium]